MINRYGQESFQYLDDLMKFINQHKLDVVSILPHGQFEGEGYHVIWRNAKRQYTRVIDNKGSADIFTVQEWLNDVKDKICSNYDGSGYWCKDDKYNFDDEVFSSEPEDATHVIWFNK